jgi:hypothetical protein
MAVIITATASLTADVPLITPRQPSAGRPGT